MKTAVILALLALICLLYHSSAAPVAPHNLLISQCCKNITRTPIRKGKIQHVLKSQSGCRVKGIIVTTVCGHKICLDGSWTWAKNLLTEFETSTANRKAPSAPFNVSPCESPSNKL